MKKIQMYWLEPGKFAAGEYPGAKKEVDARARLNTLLDAGVTMWLDLTEANEYGLIAYESLLKQEAERRGIQVTHLRRPIRDLSIPTKADMRGTLDALDQALAEGQMVYVHCWGGKGRTGSVVGCYLVRHGRSAGEALAEIRQLRLGLDLPDRYEPSPETSEQIRFVKEWKNEQ